MMKALNEFDGVVLWPGETMSFFGIAGPCGWAQGYLPAGVVGGIGYGGGICKLPRRSTVRPFARDLPSLSVETIACRRRMFPLGWMRWLITDHPISECGTIGISP